MAKLTSIRTVLAISAQLGLHVRQIDVDTAFLNAPIKEDIWVRMPKGTPLADNDDGIYISYRNHSMVSSKHQGSGIITLMIS